MTYCLNYMVVDELRIIMGEDTKVLFETYLSDSESKIQELGCLLEGRGSDAIRRVAHSLKGSSKNIGAEFVADSCAALEVAARDGISDSWEALYSEIKKNFQLAKTEINREILS